MNDDRRRDDGYEDEPLEFVNREDEEWDDEDLVEEDFEDEYEDDFDDADPDEDDAAVAAAAAAPPAMARRVGGTGRKSGGGPVMLAAAVVVVALAAWIFWPRGGGLPEGVGELTSAVTLEDSTAAAAPATRPAEVRSSDVNLGLEAPAIVPERAGETATDVADAAPEPVQRDPRNDAATPPPPVSGEPGPEGAWFVQVGAFGNAANASRLAGELRDKGFRVDTPTTTNSAGRTLTLVRVGYFRTRNAADAWLGGHADAFTEKPAILHR